jgi:hypothetical protein
MNQITSSYSFPVLEEDKFDYIEETTYEVNQVDSDNKSNSIIFEHKLTGNNLISQLLKSNEAKFITTIVLKSSMYRETTDNILEQISSAHIKQKIQLKTTFETQSFFSAIIYTGDDKEVILNSSAMGLDDFWDGATIELKKGAILARAGWRELENTASDLLTIKKDEAIEYGFDVSVVSEEGGRFIASVEAELYDKIKQLPKNDSHLRSIVIHMLCVGFMNLAKDYKHDDSELTNFKGIKLELKNKDIRTWEDEEFNPNQVACYFLKHNIKLEDNND